jgi:hypothetical protein
MGNAIASWRERRPISVALLQSSSERGATLCIAAYGFLISERETIPPSTDRATRVFPQFALREGFQPRGSAVAA